MTPRGLARLGALGAALLFLSSGWASLPAMAQGPVHPLAGSSPPVTGNITGPTYVPIGGNGTFYINGSGGPAVVGGSLVGQINWTAQVAGPDLVGVSVAPANGTISALGTPGTTVLSGGNISQTVTIEVEIKSSLGSTHAYTNLTYTVNIRAPYIVRTILTAGATAVLPFKVQVYLDGVRVGNVSVPTLVAYQAYQVVFRYANPGLPSGNHTFTLSVADEHGLVTFPGGRTSFSTTFYVASSPPNYSVWYVAGIVAFFGALFIFATRVAARRRGAGKR